LFLIFILKLTYIFLMLTLFSFWNTLTI
jgi:hypothetical protein